MTMIRMRTSNPPPMYMIRALLSFAGRYRVLRDHLLVWSPDQVGPFVPAREA